MNHSKFVTNSVEEEGIQIKNEVPVFLCYRRTDGTNYAQAIFETINGKEINILLDKKEDQKSSINLFFDKEIPAVTDWTMHHQPALERARCLIIIITPGLGADTSSGSSKDWVHYEIKWWLDNRPDSVPILIDTTNTGVRFLPKFARNKWEFSNRILFRIENIKRLPLEKQQGFNKKLEDKILNGIREREGFIRYKDIEKLQYLLKASKRKNNYLILFSCLVLGLAACAGFFFLKAKNEARVSNAHRLSTLATNVALEYPDLGILLATESYNIVPSNESIKILHSILDYDPVYLRNHSSGVIELSFNHNGSKMASASSDHSIIIWDTNKKIKYASLEGHSNNVSHAVFNSKSSKLASWAYDREIIIWDLDNNELEKRISGLGSHEVLLSLNFLEDDNYLIACYSDGQIIVWDIKRGEVLKKLTSPLHQVTEAKFSKDLKHIALTNFNDDGSIIIWDLTKEKEKFKLEGHQQVFSFDFSFDGSRLVSGGTWPGILVWDLHKGQKLFALKNDHLMIKSVNFSHNDKYIVSGDDGGIITVWDAAQGKKINDFKWNDSSVTAVKFNINNYQLAASSQKNEIVYWRAFPNFKENQFTTDSCEVFDMALDKQRDILAVSKTNNTVEIFDLKTQKSITILDEHFGPVSGVAFSPDGQFLASCSWDGTVSIWNVDDWQHLKSFDKQTDRILSITFSPDGNYIATGSFDGNIILWEAKTGLIVNKQKVPINAISPDDVTSLAFSPDGNYLAAGIGDGEVIIIEHNPHDFQTNLRIDSKKIILDGSNDFSISGIECITYSPNGKLLAFGKSDGDVSILDAKTYERLIILKGDNPINSLAFSPDSKIIATGSININLWDVNNGQELISFKGHSKWITELLFDVEGEKLISGSLDKSIRLWNTNYNSILEKACEACNRNMTKKEWNQYVGSNLDYRKTCKK